MPLHGKLVVLKRSGGDGIEFPLTATCLIGRKVDCDIRIQLPQVSKEHCRIDLNENKEVILTNLSSANPTSVNGQALQQSERLKHGDVITIIDRSFRFEYPPPPTPKKRVGGKAEVAAADPHLKDGTNIDNIQRSLEKTQELESVEDASLEKKSASPFSDLYQMIKQSLDVKTPQKSSVSVLQTPSSKFCTPKLESARKKDGTPKKVQTPISSDEKTQGGDASVLATPKSAKKRRSVQLSTEQTVPHAQEAKPAQTPSPHCNPTPQKFTLSEAVEQIATQTSKSPRQRSKATTSPASTKKRVSSPGKMETTTKATPKSSEKGTEKSKKRRSEELAADLPTQEMKRKRVSFGGHLSPELFDKRLPPDSPLRKGATPRRSLCLYKPKESLLRRASVIGLLKECDHERHVESPKTKSPGKMRTPSPKKSPKGASPKTPTSGKKSPKAQSPSQRAQSPKSKTPSPGKRSTTPLKVLPKSPKAQSPAQKAQSPKVTTPKLKSPSPGKKVATPKRASPKAASPKTVKTTPVKSPNQSKFETPKNNLQRKSASNADGIPKGKSPGRMVTPVKSLDQTPEVQGRFSVSRVNTPSPVAEDAVMVLAPSATATPKIPLRRKSMKSSTKKTPALKSSTKVMRRKSGMTRSSMKVITSWADIVRFGKPKVPVGAPTRTQVIKKTAKKKAGPKPQTPRRKLVDHVSTGHAASPATIVVGRAHRLRVAHSAGAPPKIITNTAVPQKNMKMDEDLTGLSEMFKTPKNMRRSSAKIANKTPQADPSKSFIEPSVLNTPEETGEMVVSPMSVASTVKGRRYNSEAVQRLLNESDSLTSEIPALDVQCETSDQSTEKKVGTPKTPKQKPQMPECLTGVKRMMKTPKQKAEPIEDLRGKLLKTPKQKSEQQEFLSAVKRIMKTPKEKAAPIEDLRGKLLKTPKQKLQQQEECLTGVKRIMKTPKEKAQPVEDLWGKLLKTPKQKIEQQECLSAVKTLMETPGQKVEQSESITGVMRTTRTPTQKAELQECLTGVKRIMKTPKEKYEPIDDIRGKLLHTPKQKIEQQECLTGVKRLMKTPKEKVSPVEKNFGIKRLMRSPRLRGNAPVEDFEGLEELMKEPFEEQTSAGTEETIIDERSETIPEQVVDDLSEAEKVIAAKEIVGQPESTSVSLAEETEIMPCVESVQEEGAPKMKPVRTRRAKTAEPTVKNKQVHSDGTEATGRVRRERRVDTTAPGQTAGSVSAKTPEEPVQKESAFELTVKPRRGRVAKKAKEMLDEGQTESTAEPQTESEQTLPPADQDVEQSTAVVEPVVKTRGRKNKDEPCDVITTCETAQAAEETNEAMPAAILEDSTERQKKPARGRKAKVIEPEVPAAAENKDVSEEADAPVRGRRGKKTEAPAASAIRQRRGRAGKAQENVEDKVVLEEPHHISDTISEHADDQASAPKSTEKIDQEKSSAPIKEMDQEKPRRGRKIKAPIDPVQPEPEIIAVNGEQLVAEAKQVEDVQREQSVPKTKSQRGKRVKTQAETGTTVEESNSSVCEAVKDAQVEHLEPTQKPRKGGRTKPAAEPSLEAEITTVESEPVEIQPTQAAPTKKPNGRRVRAAVDSHTTEVSEVPVQGKRSRTAKLEQDKKATDEKKSPEPAKKMRRIQKNEPSEEILTTKAVEETPVIVEAFCAAPKSRRGAHKTKEVATEEVSASSSTDKPKRGRNGKQRSEDVIAVEVEAAEPEPEKVIAKGKPIRERRTAVQPGASDSVPAKRVRRGAALSTEESTEQNTQMIAMPVPVEPVKRGRRAAKTPACTEEAETKDQDNSTKESSNGIEDTQTSKRSVKWKAEFEIIEVTPLKTTRGRKTKSAGQKGAESSNEPQKATNPEEEDLTENTQPAKRTRRGVKAADVAEESTKVTVEKKEAETQPKTRRGRTAKK